MSENNQNGISFQKDKITKKNWRFNYKYVLTSFIVLLLLGSNVFLTSERLGKVPDLSSLIATPAKANPVPTSLNYSNLDLSSYTPISKLDFRELSINYAYNTPVWISTSPNAYAYHKTYSCAANRTKYEVIKVTTTEAREKYHRAPCKICQPK